MIDFYEQLISKYPIISIKNDLAEDDWSGLQELTQKLKKGGRRYYYYRFSRRSE